jgi:hypothetical protein
MLLWPRNPGQFDGLVMMFNQIAEDGLGVGPQHQFVVTLQQALVPEIEPKRSEGDVV